jgi:hypothetical protein
MRKTLFSILTALALVTAFSGCDLMNTMAAGGSGVLSGSNGGSSN